MYWHCILVGFLGWFFGFSIVVILPLDLASTLYRNCLEKGTRTCDEPLAYVSEKFLWTFWAIVYWTMFNLTWFVIPIQQSWIRSGEFTIRAKLKEAVRDNLIYYACVGLAGLIFLAYIAIVKKFQKEDLMAFAMAGANAWGLFLVTIFLGYGLVEVPRGLWYSASTRWKLAHLEFEAPKMNDAVMDAEAEVYGVAREIAIISQKTPYNHELRPIVDRLMEKAPLALEERGEPDEGDAAPEVNISNLANLHCRNKRAMKLIERAQARYNFLLQNAFLLQDIVEQEDSPERKFLSKLRPVKESWYKGYKMHFDWVWLVWLKPLAVRGLSIVCALASLAIIWSESTFQVESPRLSIPALLLFNPDIPYGVLQLISIGFILYMCSCAYTTLFKVQYFDYRLVPEHHTDDGSILFAAAYLCRLTFPLCYNFLKLIGDHDNSVFVMFLGESAELTPLLGEGYNTWLPEVILVFCVVTFFNLHGRILRLFRVKAYFYEEVDVHDERTKDGRTIIKDARSREERKILQRGGVYAHANNSSLSSAEGGLGVHKHATRGGGPNRGAGAKTAATTDEFVAKYRARQTGSDSDRTFSSMRNSANAAGSSNGNVAGSRLRTGGDTSQSITNTKPTATAASASSIQASFTGYVNAVQSKLGKGATPPRSTTPVNQGGDGKFERLQEENAVPRTDKTGAVAGGTKVSSMFSNFTNTSDSRRNRDIFGDL
ncbi:hypothetical protein SeMB42_g05216 [Synchytrium endobioticum]|uniref:LMBR1-like membrane protein n=1 Tax=Synchytrium endobioticum TaxID=286115 RepID=A0A507CSX6_9FUNG|nr:hypothetical protein SeMB42_g05216 [Synchytrium endobioticum]